MSWTGLNKYNNSNKLITIIPWIALFTQLAINIPTIVFYCETKYINPKARYSANLGILASSLWFIYAIISRDKILLVFAFFSLFLYSFIRYEIYKKSSTPPSPLQ